MSGPAERTGSCQRMTTHKPSPNVMSREVAGETVLVDLDSELYFSLNQTGAFIWSGVTSGLGCGEIADAVVERFGIEHDRASADVGRLVDELVEAGLLLPA